MHEQKKTVETHVAPAGRSEWKRPEVRAIEAGSAEAAGGGAADLGVLS
jgi:hypothetical protein